MAPKIILKKLLKSNLFDNPETITFCDNAEYGELIARVYAPPVGADTIKSAPKKEVVLGL